MEVLQYRDTGELSDLCVCVGGEDFKLHKFPLYIKSEYFKTAAQGNEKIDLKDFPGGQEIFSLVADFCYGKSVDFTLGNIAGLRCAAEFLQMKGSGNLIAVTERYLEDVISSARMSRSIAPIVEILSQCKGLQPEGDQAKVGEKCFHAIIDSWNRYGRSSISSYKYKDMFQEDNVVTDKLIELPLDWFVELIKTLEEKKEETEEGEEQKPSAVNKADNEQRLRSLADLVCRYLARVIEASEAPQTDEKEEKPAKEAPKKEKAKKEPKKEDDEDKPEGEEGEGDEDEDKKAEKKEEKEAAGSDTEADVAEKTATKEMRGSRRRSSQTEDDREKKPSYPKLEHGPGEIMDRVIDALPENTPLSEMITVEWIRKAMEVAEKHQCHCRERLLQLAGNILHKFTTEELKEIPKETLCEIVDNTIHNKKVAPDVLCCVLDNYLLDLAKKTELSVDHFVKLVKSVPDDYRVSHDTLYDVMEQLLTSGEDISDEKKKELLTAVDLSRCHERTLQRCLEKGLVPSKQLCQAAIDLAGRLRGDRGLDVGRSYKHWNTGESSTYERSRLSGHGYSPRSPRSTYPSYGSYSSPYTSAAPYESSYDYSAGYGGQYSSRTHEDDYGGYSGGGYSGGGYSGGGYSGGHGGYSGGHHDDSFRRTMRDLQDRPLASSRYSSRYSSGYAPRH